MRKLLLLTFVGLLAACSVTASGQSPTPPPDLRIGSEFMGKGWAYSVRQSDLSKTVTIRDFSRPDVYTANGTFLTVLVRVTNLTTQGNATLRSGDFLLVDGSGIKYNPIRLSRLYAREGYAELGEIFTPQVPLLTQLYFDIAPGATGLRLLLVKDGVFIRLE